MEAIEQKVENNSGIIEKPSEREEVEKYRQKKSFAEDLKEEANSMLQLEAAYMGGYVNVNSLWESGRLGEIEKKEKELVNWEDSKDQIKAIVESIRELETEAREILIRIKEKLEELVIKKQVLESLEINSPETAEEIRKQGQAILSEVNEIAEEFRELYRKLRDITLIKKQKLAHLVVDIPDVDKFAFATDELFESYPDSYLYEYDKKIKGRLWGLIKPNKKNRTGLEGKRASLQELCDVKEVFGRDFGTEIAKELQAYKKQLTDIQEAVYEVATSKMFAQYKRVYEDINSRESSEDSKTKLSTNDWLEINLSYVKNSNLWVDRVGAAGITLKLLEIPEVKELLDQFLALKITQNRTDLEKEDLDELSKKLTESWDSLKSFLRKDLVHKNAEYSEGIEVLINKLPQAVGSYLEQERIDTEESSPKYQAIQQQLLSFIDSAEISYKLQKFYEAFEPFYRQSNYGVELLDAEISGRIEKLHTEQEEIVSSFDLSIWKSLLNSEVLKKKIGEAKLDQVEQLLLESIIRQIIKLRTDNHSRGNIEQKNKAEYLSKTLMTFKRPDTIPFIIMNAYEHVGDSGRRMLIERNPYTSVIYDFASSLSEQDLANLLRIKGAEPALKILNLMRNNPDTFDKYFIDDPEIKVIKKLLVDDEEFLAIARSRNASIAKNDQLDPRQLKFDKHDGGIVFSGGWGWEDSFFLSTEECKNLLRKYGKREDLLYNATIDNPIMGEIEENLSKLVVQILHGDNEDMKRYSLTMIKEDLQYLDIGVVLNTLADLDPYSLDVCRNMQVAENLLCHVQYHGDEFEDNERRKTLAGILKISREEFDDLIAFIQENNDPKLTSGWGNDYKAENYSKYLDLSKNKKAREFIRRLREGLGLRFQVEESDKLLQLSNHPQREEILSFASELRDYKYEFSLDDVATLIDLLEIKTQFILDLQEIKENFPNFEYELNRGSVEASMPYHVLSNKYDAISVLKQIVDDKKKIPESLKKLASRKPYEYLMLVDEYQDAEFEHPLAWGDMYVRLKSLQSPSAREDYDPWRKELKPLVATAIDQGLLNPTDPKDGEILYDYVRRYGMLNLPILLKLHIVVSRAQNLDNFGIIRDDLEKIFRVSLQSLYESKQCQKKIGVLKSMILDKLKDLKDSIQSKLLQDEIPTEVENTELGMEIFKMLRGKTNWSRVDRIKENLELWRNTLRENPKIGELPEGYHEVTFEVPIRVRRQETESETEKRERMISQIVEDSDLAVHIDKYAKAHMEAIEIDNLVFWWERKKAEISSGIVREVESLEAKTSRIENDKARVGIRKKIEHLNNIKERINEIEIREISDTVNKPALQAEDLIKKLIGSFPDKEYEDLIRTVSAFHSLAISDLEATGMRPMLEEMLARKEQSGKLTEKIILHWGKFLKDWLDQHYFGKEGQVSFTNFEKPILMKLRKTWGVKGSIGEHKISQSAKNLQNLLDSSYELSEKTVPVTLVPVRGPLLQYGGYLGDACWTSQVDKFAKGEFPNITGFVYVTNRGTEKERLMGSLLAIETKTADEKDGVLLIRANNPQEALGGMLDQGALLKNTLREMKELAARRKLKETGIPIDAATASCSNRDYVATYYSENYANNTKIALKDEPATNFNGYKNWDPESSHPVVRI